MQRIKNEDLRDPNVCFICEESVDGDTVLDTERYAPFNPTYPLNGRKYICERCGGEIADRLGYESGAEVQAARADADRAREELGNVRQRTTELADHIRDFVSSPVSLDPAASADALEAVFSQNDSAAALALDPQKLDKQAPPEDIVAKLPLDPRDEIDYDDPKSIEARVEPQAPNGAEILENPQVAAKVETFDGNINENENSAVVPPEFLEANQPVERDINNDVVDSDLEPGSRKEDGTFEVNEESLKQDEANAEKAADLYGDLDATTRNVSDEAVAEELDASGVEDPKKSAKGSKKK